MVRLSAGTRRWIGLGFVMAIVLVVGALPATANTAGTGLVISQVYGGGGNSGATLTNDFIEIFNRGAAPVAVDGWSVQYASSAGTTWQVTLLAGTIQPGKYYLVQEAQGAGGTTPLPTPDATGTIAMSGTNGKVALVSSTSALSGACPSAVDVVGYGSANCFEGSAATGVLSNPTAALRNGGGCTDTDDNAADFTVGAPDPRNSATPANSCAATTDPTGTGAASPGTVAPGGSVLLTIAVTPGTNPTSTGLAVSADLSSIGGAATQMFYDDGTNGDVTAGDNTFSFQTAVSGATPLGAKSLPASIGDAQARTGAASIDLTVDACFGAATPIHDVQGSGLTSPILGSGVVVEGIVVGAFQDTISNLGGYFLQAPDAAVDADPATSEGVFVFVGAFGPAVSVGDVVRVHGKVAEFNGLTELNGVTAAQVCSTGNPLPAPTDVNLPFADADAPESYEGMRVHFPQQLVISEYFNYDRFGEIVLAAPLAGESRPFTGTAIDEPGAAANARTAANALSRITLDDLQSAQNPSVLPHPNGSPFSLANRFRGGDLVEGQVGVLGYSFGLYRILPTASATYTVVNPRPAAPEPVGGSVRVAAMNTLNFFVTADYPTGDPLDNKCGPANNVECRGWDSDQADEFTRQRDKLLAALTGLDADVIGLNEMENSTGVEPLESITTGLPGYDYVHTGTIGTDAIKVGLIYRPAVVTPVGAFQTLDSTDDPRFIDTKSRPALAQTFEVNATGARFTVVVNHLKSKGSACDDVGDPDQNDGQANCSGTRTLAAQALVDWLATDPTGSGDPDFLIMGDLNSYAMEDPIDAIKAGSDDTAGTGDDFTNLISAFQGPFAYSYVFDGQAGYLDHALANASMSAQVTGAADWHINSDESDVLDYDTSFKPPAQDALYEPNAYRSSDHDPVVIGLDPTLDYDGLCALTERLVTNKGVAKGLCKKLEQAEKAAAKGKTKDHDKKLADYRKKLDKETGKSVSASDAALLKSLSLSL